jgi:hypothetical protein
MPTTAPSESTCKSPAIYVGESKHKKEKQKKAEQLLLKNKNYKTVDEHPRVPLINTIPVVRSGV